MKEVFRENPLCFWNGHFVPRDTIWIDPYDLGFLRGYVVFDVLPVVNGKPFLPERHYERLVRSARELRLTVPADQEEYLALLRKLVAESPFVRTIVRTVLSGGPSGNGFTPEPGKETFLVLVEASKRLPDEYYARGVKLITLEYERPLPQVKFASHALAIRDLSRRTEKGAFETLYTNAGMVSEASQSNLFIVKNGRLATTWNNVLWGITQGLLLELAERLGIPSEKRAISTEELFQADEVFITGSSKGIVPVARIDETIIGEGIPGPVTRRLMTAFEEFVGNY